MKKKHIQKWIHYTPRILGIVFVLFLMLFSLDVFSAGYGFRGTAIALLVHNVPALLLALILLMSWKYEIIGAIVFPFAGLAYILTIIGKVHWQLVLSWSALIAGPAFLIGILFLLDWKQKKRK